MKWKFMPQSPTKKVSGMKTELITVSTRMTSLVFRSCWVW